MSTLKARRVTPETTLAAPKPALRLATSGDAGEQPEVALLQRYIEAEFAEPVGPRPWPGVVRVPLIVGASAALWWGIVVGARALLRM